MPAAAAQQERHYIDIPAYFRDAAADCGFAYDGERGAWFHRDRRIALGFYDEIVTGPFANTAEVRRSDAYMRLLSSRIAYEVNSRTYHNWRVGCVPFAKWGATSGENLDPESVETVYSIIMLTETGWVDVWRLVNENRIAGTIDPAFASWAQAQIDGLKSAQEIAGHSVPDSAAIEMVRDEVERGILAAGRFGTCTWTLGRDGRLAVEGGTLERPRGDAGCPWGAWADRITSIALGGPGNEVVLPHDCSEMFSSLPRLGRIDLRFADASRVSDMTGMFRRCARLAEIDMRPLEVSSCRSMSGMFEGCASLSAATLPETATSRLEDASFMFFGCGSLQRVLPNGFDLSAAKELSSMFEECASLGGETLPQIPMPPSARMGRMFAGCAALAPLDCSGWDMSRCGYLRSMFEGCPRIPVLGAAPAFPAPYSAVPDPVPADQKWIERWELPSPALDIEIGRTGMGWEWTASVDRNRTASGYGADYGDCYMQAYEASRMMCPQMADGISDPGSRNGRCTIGEIAARGEIRPRPAKTPPIPVWEGPPRRPAAQRMPTREQLEARMYAKWGR